MKDEFCPCCERHCNLSAPHCGRGAAYAATAGEQRFKECGLRDRAEERRQRYLTLDTDNKLICNIRDLGHTVRSLSDGKASRSRILIILSECKTITQSDLTERLCVQPGTVSEVIGKLERAGLIVRSENEKDKRTCELRLTEEGLSKATEAAAERKKRYAEMFSHLSDDEKDALLSLLEKVNSDWQARYGDCGRSALHIDEKRGFDERSDTEYGHHRHGRHRH